MPDTETDIDHRGVRLRAAPQAAGDESVLELSAVELAGGIRRGEIGPIELMRAVLDRADRVDKVYSCFQTVDPGAALAAGERAERELSTGADLGVLHGIPLTVKDLVGTAGLPTRWGSARPVQPAPDAPSIRLLGRSGAIIVGKTTTPEFGHKAVTDSLISPPTRNPWDPRRTAGGSSGGAAVAVATGIGPVAVATDGGGSIRIPAAFCGVLGVKPTSGTVPTYPPSKLGVLGHVGVISRSAADAALTLDVLSGRAEAGLGTAPPIPLAAAERAEIRVGHFRSVDGHDPDPAVQEAFERTVDLLRQSGFRVIPVPVDFPDAGPVWDALFLSAMAVEVGGSTDPGYPISPTLRSAVQDWAAGPQDGALDGETRRAVLRHRVAALFDDVDLLLSPTLPVTAFPVGQPGPADRIAADGHDRGWWRNTQLWNLTGMPAASFPAGCDRDGLPIGMHLAAPWGRDQEMLRMLVTLERDGIVRYPRWTP